jgi:predicted transposase/invertase (TIGR01784 family)
MDVGVNKAEEKLQRLSADPETRREYERRAKALSDERSRLEDAKEEGIETGILNVVKKLIDSGMPLDEAAKFTPYSAQQLSKMLKVDD